MYSLPSLEPVHCSIPVVIVASWPAYRFLRRQVRWSDTLISLRIFHFPSGSDGKESVCNVGEFSPRLEKIPWRRECNPLQYSCLKNSMDRGAWWARVMGSQGVRHGWVTNTTTTSLLYFKENIKKLSYMTFHTSEYQKQPVRIQNLLIKSKYTENRSNYW